MHIHPTAIIDDDVRIGDNVSIGPYTLVESGAVIGDHCQLAGRVTIKAGTCLGSHTRVFEGAVLGGTPQHLQVTESTGGLQIGRHNTIRENVTIHRALRAGDLTTVGDHNLIMVNAHIAHDCRIGNHTVLINGTLIAGHCTVEDRAYLAGGAGVQQFRRVGQLAAIGGYGRALKDVPPFVTLDGLTERVVGLNVIALRRAGFRRDDIRQIKAAYQLIYRSGLRFQEMLRHLRDEFCDGPASDFHRFLSTCKYGFMAERRAPAGTPTIKLFPDGPPDATVRSKVG